MTSNQILVFFHVMLGEIGSLMFLWAGFELLAAKSVLRTRVAATAGMTLLIAAWGVSGYYYLTHYGSVIRQLLKTSRHAWVHGILMEVKEHIFLLLPILGIVVLMFSLDKHLQEDFREDERKAVASLSFLVFLLGFSLTALGAIISLTARSLMSGGA